MFQTSATTPGQGTVPATSLHFLLFLISPQSKFLFLYRLVEIMFSHSRFFRKCVLSITNSAFLSRGVAPTTSGPGPVPVAVPAPAVPPYRKRAIKISYEIYDHAYQHGRRKDAKFVFTASYELSDDNGKTHHSDD